MRIRGRHIFIALLLFAGAFVVLTTQVQAPRETATPAASAPPLQDPDAGAPRIAVETTELRLGTVPNSGVTRVPFEVRNEGEAPLVLNTVKTNCACTQGIIPPGSETVAPGKHTAITVVFDPHRVFGFHSHKTLTIWSNDPATPQVAVSVIANIEPEFLLEPEQADFGEVEKGEPAGLEITLRQARDEPVEVHDVRPAGGRFSSGANDLRLTVARTPPAQWADANKAEYRIGVSLPPDVPPGPLQRVFEIHTNVARAPRIPVAVTANVLAPYTVEPRFPRPLMLRRQAAPETAAEGELTVKGAAPLRIEDIDVPPALLVEQDADPDGATVRLRVSLAADAPPGMLDETLRYTVCAGGRRYPERAVVRAVNPRGPAAAPTEDGAEH